MSEEIEAKFDAERAARPGGFATRCGRCLYWQIEFLERDSEDHPEDWQGECHRRAPTSSQWFFSLTAELIGKIAWAIEEQQRIEHERFTEYVPGEAAGAQRALFPVTSAHNWCGEFVERPNSDHDDAIKSFLENVERKSESLNERLHERARAAK
jgi:hypothetical protein